MNNINILYQSKCPPKLTSLLNDAATSVNETCDNLHYKLKQVSNINNNVNTCSCMLHLLLLQVIYTFKLEKCHINIILGISSIIFLYYC